MEADRRGSGVVFDDARPAEPRLERVAQGEVRPAEVDGDRDVAGDRVDPARDADPDDRHVVDVRAGVGERGLDGRGDRLGGTILVARRGGPGRATEDGAVGRGDEHRDLRPADVDADEERPGGGRAGRGAHHGGGLVSWRRSVVIGAPSGRARGSAAARTSRGGPRRPQGRR